MPKRERRSAHERQQARNLRLLSCLTALFAAYAVAVTTTRQYPGTGDKRGIPLTPREIDELSLWWFAPFFSGGGYSSEAIDFALALAPALPDKMKISHHGDSFSMDFFTGLPQGAQQTLSSLNSKYIDPEHSIAVCHSEPGAWTPALYETPPCPIDGMAYIIGRTMFETDQISPGWVQRCNEVVDEVWVPTDFHYKTFRDSGVKSDRIVVMPEPIDTKFWSRKAAGKATSLPRRRRMVKKLKPIHQDQQGVCGEPEVECSEVEVEEKCFAFLSVFKWEHRKGWDILLQAFVNEFQRNIDNPHTDNVCLYIKTRHFHSDEEFHETILNYGMQHWNWTQEEWEARAPMIEVISDDIPQEKMPQLYKAADVVVIPSRGEGWGRPHVEAMAMGLPLIATNWSGPTAFMTSENSYPLNIDGLDTIQDGPWKGHRWARPDVNHLRYLMRHVFTHPEERKEVGKRGRRSMSPYSMENVAHVVEGRLRVIKDKLKLRHAAQQQAKDSDDDLNVDDD